MSKEAMELALEALEHTPTLSPAVEELCDAAITALREALAEQPAQQEMPDDWFKGMPEEYRREAWRIKEQPEQREPVAFPTRKAVEREIERTTSPTGMHLNDGKERVALPGGTLRHMLALIDRTSPAQRQARSADTWVNATTWRGLTHEEHMEIMTGTMTTSSRMAAVEAKLKEKNSD